jgi:lysine-N-methylase
MRPAFGFPMNHPATNLAATGYPTIEPEPACQPTYGAHFRCIGSACEDTCCHGFAIPLDRKSYEQYQNFRQPSMAALAARFVILNPAPGKADSLYAHLDLLPTGDCPFFTTERLCGIQLENGPEALCATCSIYPRVLNKVDEGLEVSLNLSCPEAARQVLLNPAMFNDAFLPAHTFRTDQSSWLATEATSPIHKPWQHFVAIRVLVMAILRDRKRSLGQRLFLLGSFCRALNDISSSVQNDTVPAMLSVYRSTLAQAPNAATLTSTEPAPSAVPLDVVLQLSALRLQEGGAGERFRHCFEEFQRGIGYCLESTADGDLRRFHAAEEQYCRPFFARHPHMLENFLVNSVFRTLFPFGRGVSVHAPPLSISDAYLLMATQFGWIYGLLSGVAGFYQQHFGPDQVVRVIQSYAKAVEHHPGFILKILAFAKTRHLDAAEGIADLLQC